MTRSAFDKVAAQLAPASAAKKKPVKPVPVKAKVTPVAFSAVGITFTTARDDGHGIAGKTSAVLVDDSRLDVPVPSPAGPLVIDTLTESQAELMAAAEKGRKFRPGKPKGSVGTVRKEIQRLLKLHRDATASDLWDMLRGDPPPGWHFFDNHIGQYIEIDGKSHETKRKSFENAVSKERKAIG